jgi:hypothetical protein
LLRPLDECKTRTQRHLRGLAGLCLPVQQRDALQQAPVHRLLQLLQQQVRARLPRSA